MATLKFRFHRGSLVDSMDTLVELPATVQALIDHVQDRMPDFPFNLDDLRMKSTGPDERIDWPDTWLVRFEGFGVVGMATALPEDAPATVHIPVLPDRHLMFRPQDGSNLRSFAGMCQLPATMDSLLIHLAEIGKRWKGVVKIHKTKPNRSLGWDEQWSVRNEIGHCMGMIDRLPFDVPHECLATGKSGDDLRRDDIVKVSAFSMEPVPEGKSAYHIDPVRSGQAISAGWDIMFESGKDVLDEVVLVNTTTGQRVLVKFEALTDKFGN